MSSTRNTQTTIQESTDTLSPTEEIVRSAAIGDQIRLDGLSNSTALDELTMTGEVVRTHGTDEQDHLVLDTPRGPMHICAAGSRTRFYAVVRSESGHELRPADGQRVPTMEVADA